MSEKVSTSSHDLPRNWRCTRLARRLLLLASMLPAGPVLGQTPATDGDASAETLRRLDEQEARLRSLETMVGEPREAAAPTPAEEELSWFVGYDKGFVLRSRDMERNPYELQINGRMQLNYTGFVRDEETFTNLGTDESGEPIDVHSRNDFEIERARLEFRGTFWDPRMHFYINIDADTDDDHRAIFHDFWFNYEFCEGFDLHLGKAFVPGSREWLNGSTTTQLVDRSVATTFFRPDRTVGLWASGEPIESFHYRAMLGNGFQTADMGFPDINQDFVYSGSVWWEPLGDFGSGFSDLKPHEDPVVRVGSSLTYAEEDGTTDSGGAIAESNFLRLDDGTRLTSLGVNHFDLTLLAVDAALKWSGFSLSGEAYYRWIDRIRPTGAAPGGFPDDENESWGAYLAAGYMLLPEKLELVARTSTIQGDFKDSWEYAAGVNFFIDGSHRNKLALDVTRLDGVPVGNSGPNLVLGDDGTLVRLMYQIAF